MKRKNALLTSFTVVAGIAVSLTTVPSAVLAATATATASGTTMSLGTITLYTSDGLESYYQSVLPAFEKKYGAKVNIVTDGSGAVVNRLELQKNSPQADVIVTMPPFVQQAEQDGLLQKYVSAQTAAIPASRKDAKGEWETFVDNYINFAYNPKLTKTPPKTFQDLLSSAYKGKVAYSNPLSAGDGMAVLIMTERLWGIQGAIHYLKQLESNVKFHTKGTGYLDVLLNRGEIGIANGDLQMDISDDVQGNLNVQPLFLRPSAKSAPVTFEDPYVIGLVHGAPNSAGGKALVDYLLSKPVQAQVFSIFGLPARNDVKFVGKNAQMVKNALKGVRVLSVDWTTILKDETKWQSQWQSGVLNAYGKQGSVTGS